MEIKELRRKSEAELHKFLKAKREEFRDLRFKVAGKQHKDVRDLREVKKSIAKIMTILNEKKIVTSIKEKNKNNIKEK